MKDLVEVIAKSLVDHPEEVVVNQTEESNCDFSRIEGGTFRYGQGDWPFRDASQRQSELW